MRRIARHAALALAAGLTAAGAAAADLEQVYRDALAYDAALASARASREAGLEKLPQGRALLLPSLSVTGNTTWNDLTLKHLTPDVSRGYNSNGWQAQLTQPLFRWQNWVQYKQGELQSTLAEAQYQLARQDLTLRAAQAYFDVLTAQDALAAVSALYDANTQQLALAKKSFEVGTVTITDVHEAQSRADLSSAQVIAAESDLAVKRHALLVLTGKEPDTLKSLRKGVALSRPEPADIQSWVSAAEGSNLSVQAAQIAGEIAGREVERNRAGHLPTVDVVASYGNSATANALANFINTDIRSTVVALQVNVPVFQGGAVSSRVREAAALRDKATADLDNARRTSAQNARQAYLGVTSGLAQVKAFEAAQVSSASALDANKLGYDVGVRINIDVLNAQSQLYDTRQKLAKARYDTLMAQLKLKAAAGSLVEDDIKAINALLD
ncbi:MAG: TolC family outer membrane protein [Zoogloea sp.]|uniref:TolC family outer membrane protein n=1 Tax=Zoogloea sp. TaxID=49181 RepID=UPI002635D43B|nr:TolC family outer membrane protein [Zoogloea sp.]MDD2988458.1 TolC family outer membrane protein [Zoogloea sp.]